MGAALIFLFVAGWVNMAPVWGSVVLVPNLGGELVRRRFWLLDGFNTVPAVWAPKDDWACTSVVWGAVLSEGGFGVVGVFPVPDFRHAVTLGATGMLPDNAGRLVQRGPLSFG